MTTSTRRGGLVAMGMALAALAAPADAQYGGQRGGARNEPPKIIERVKPHEWTLTTRVTVRIDQFFKDSRDMPTTTGFKFDTVSVVFPILDETASSIAAPVRPVEGAEPYRPYITGRLLLNDQPVDEHPDVLANYAAGARLGKWVHRDWSGTDMTLEVVYPVTSYQTEFDEKLATAVKWPDAWPEPAASCMQPQYWIDLDPVRGAYDMTPVKEFVRRATDGKDPRSIPPATLAKWLAGRVMEAVNPSGDGLNFTRTGELEGVDLKGAPQTLLDGRGSDFDMVCVLAAVYRAAGLPARTVIGYDAGKGKTESRFLGKRGSAELRAWVEFPLLEPTEGKLVWVPVDVVRMRKSGSRAKPLNQRWPYFGEHDELDRVMPFAFQFHPPTTVVAHGSPAFWGWLVTPKPPEQVMQTVRFLATTTPTTAEEQKRRREEERLRREGKTK